MLIDIIFNLYVLANVSFSM